VASRLQAVVAARNLGLKELAAADTNEAPGHEPADQATARVRSSTGSGAIGIGA
jgi:hypothetical protein